MAVSVLMYHDLRDDGSPLSLHPSAFTWQMQWLREQGYAVLSLARLVAMLRGAEPLPAHAVVLTFDDGFQSVYEVAVPILAKFGFTATVFLVSDYCGRWNDWPSQPVGVARRRLMTWAQVREAERSGIEFGAHTATHPPLDRLSPADLQYEIVTAKQRIEDRLGHAVDVFAYPYGRLTREVRAIVAGVYSAACDSRPGLVRSGSNPMQLSRIDVHYLRQPSFFRQLGSPAFPAYVALRRSGRWLGTHLLRRPWR